MNVWIMNLKDNRDVKPEDLTKSKFEFCKENCIVGIGWANSNTDSTDDISCIQANNTIDSFEVNDLVWVKNPLATNGEEEYFICKITGQSKATDDEIMNKNDIGKYCTCEYYPVMNIPKGFDGERLIAVHTIEKASDSAAQKTIAFFNGYTNRKNFNKKKISIIAIICISIIVLGIIANAIVKFVNKKTHPILPKNLEFGMTYDEIENNTAYIDDLTTSIINYLPLKKEYNFVLLEEGEKNFKANYPLNVKNDKLMIMLLKLNENKEFYEISFIFDSDKREDTDFKVLCDYYKKAFGGIEIKKDGDGSKIAIFKNNGITCTIYESTLMFNIVDEKYSPYIPEISKEAIVTAFDSLKYNVGGFTINLATLLKECVSDIDITYGSVYSEVYEFNEIPYNDTIIEKLEENYPEYAATSYLVTVHGDICQNPDLPYMKSEDVDVIKLILIFDDNENLIDYIVYKQSNELYTYAALTMF